MKKILFCLLSAIVFSANAYAIEPEHISLLPGQRIDLTFPTAQGTSAFRVSAVPHRCVFVQTGPNTCSLYINNVMIDGKTWCGGLVELMNNIVQSGACTYP